MTIWIDVDDLMEFFRNAATPTGIQRLSFETCRALWVQAGKDGNDGEIGFCRQSPGRMGFRAILFPALESVILSPGGIAPRHIMAAPQPAPPIRRPMAMRLLRRLRALPPQFRRPLGALRMAAGMALRAARDLARACLHPALRQAGPGEFPRDDRFDVDGVDIAFAPGDWLVCLGAGWNRPYAANLLQELRAQGAGFALLVYDLIPETFPEWCQYSVAQDFAYWLRHVVPKATRVFTISRHTAADFGACMARLGFDVPEPLVLPVGSHRVAGARQAVLAPRPYVLVVGTIEIRKNHAALLRVWRRLLLDPPPGGVPELVIAGKPGWLTGDLMQQLRDTGGLGGYIRLVEAPGEAALAALYAGCLFTVFPAFYEGWGLPVTESLCHGKTVAASRNAAIPEAGGAFCAYFDPDDVSEMYRVIRGLVEHPDRVAALEALIADGFHPPGWGDTAACLLSALETYD